MFDYYLELVFKDIEVGAVKQVLKPKAIVPVYMVSPGNLIMSIMCYFFITFVNLSTISCKQTEHR